MPGSIRGAIRVVSLSELLCCEETGVAAKYSGNLIWHVSSMRTHESEYEEVRLVCALERKVLPKAAKERPDIIY